MLISVTLLLLLQVVYAFAFNDSSSLMGYQQELPAFQDPLDVSLFYPSAVLQGAHVPLSNLTASIFSSFFSPLPSRTTLRAHCSLSARSNSSSCPPARRATA